MYAFRDSIELTSRSILGFGHNSSLWLHDATSKEEAHRRPCGRRPYRQLPRTRTQAQTRPEGGGRPRAG